MSLPQRSAELHWGDSVREMLSLSETSEAELARKSGLKAPVLFRYLRGQRQPTHSVVRRVNKALSEIVRSMHVFGYLQAIATRDGLIPISEVSDLQGDFDDALTIVAKHMQEGFADQLRTRIDNLGRDDRESFYAGLIADSRRRFTRHVTGTSLLESRLAAFLRIAAEHNLQVLDFLRSESELEDARREREFEVALERALMETGLPVRARLECESRIRAAFSEAVAQLSRDALHMAHDARRLGRLEAEGSSR